MNRAKPRKSADTTGIDVEPTAPICWTIWGNLLAAARSEVPDSLAAKFFLKSTDAFLAPEKVAAYLIDEGTAQNVMDEEKIIDWGTFADISERLVQLYFEIS